MDMAVSRSQPGSLIQRGLQAITQGNLMAARMTFDAALAELEQIVENMECGQLPLDQSLTAYRRASELLKHCQQKLDDAEREIDIFENGTHPNTEPTASSDDK
jgi:exodeoxyribonuclease VII small subunit